LYPHDHKPEVSDQRERTDRDAPQAPLPGRPVPPQAPLPGRPVLLRLFIGIPLAAATTNDLAAAVHRLRSQTKDHADNNLRWSAPESWHITLQFLGSSTPQQYECVAARLHTLRQPPVPIELGALGTFDRAGVFFVDVRITPQLLALQRAITAATAPCGFVAENRPYHPHITLARRKGKSSGREFRNLKLHIRHQPTFASVTARSFVLYESVPTPEGSRYESRERFLLDTLK
jgi:2'-5' RNA ligase